MKINGVIESGNVKIGQSEANMITDSVSKNIQNQIVNLQKQLQELSSNEEITIEEKLKKRQELQQEITKLNQQLRQHQIDLRKEQQKKALTEKNKEEEQNKNELAKDDSKDFGLSQASMQAIVSGDSYIKQANAQGSTTTKMKGKAGVLETEIKLDAGRGVSTEKKEEELENLQKKIQESTASQISILSKANDTMKKAEKADQQSNESVNEKNNKLSNKIDSETDNTNKKDYENNKDNIKKDEERNTEFNEKSSSKNLKYKHIDIYLG